MIHITEWMPDPGPRSPDQWVEIFNDGNRAVDLTGWHLQTTAKKPLALSGIVGAHQYKVLTKADFKFTLRKTDGKLALFNSANTFVDSASYHGKAIRYESVNRIGQATFFGKPTPGAKNVAEATTLINNSYPLHVPLPGTAFVTSAVNGTFLGMLFSTALALALVTVFMFTIHDDLSELFFGRY